MDANHVNIFTLIVVIVTTIWVFIDSKAIGVRKGILKGAVDMGRVGWVLSCAGLWVVGFPLYLAKRNQYKRANGQPEGPGLVNAIGWPLFVAVAGLIGFGLVWGFPVSTEMLEQKVRASIVETLGKGEVTKNLSVQTFGLVHKGGNDYEGILGVTANGKNEKLIVSVTYDNKNFVWKILPQNVAKVD